MRVLVFSTAYIPFIGGAEIAVKEITNRLPEIEFDLITARLDKKLATFERLGAVNVYRIGFGVPLLDKLLLPFIGIFKAYTLNRKNPYQVFWCIMATYASGAAYIFNILQRLFWKKPIPIVLTLQEGDSELYLYAKWAGILHLSWLLALPRTTILTAISSYLLERARRLGFRGKAAFIPNGVGLENFQFSPHSFQGKNNIILITTSRLVPKNGIIDAIRSLKFLPEKVSFKILGVGKLEEELRLEVKKLNLENRVEFLGLVDQKEIPKYLAEADIFVRTSLSEGMGNSFIEAMAAGIPVIATPVGGIVDFLFDPEHDPNVPPTGLFAEIRNPESIAQQVKRLLNEPLLCETLTKNARKLVTEKYDWDLIARDMKEKVFDVLIET